MSNTNIQNILSEVNKMFDAADEALNEWKGDGNLQFPVLLAMVALKLNWSEKQCRENDAVIRLYVRKHPDWEVTRGAHGGIMRAEEKQKKDAVKFAKELAKAQMQAAIEAKVEVTSVSDENNSDSDQNDLN